MTSNKEDTSNSASAGKKPKVFMGQVTPFYYYYHPELRPRKKYVRWEEYSRDLELWLKQAYFWNAAAAAFPYHYHMSQLQSRSQGPQRAAGHQTQAAGPQDNTQEGIECRVPPIWKRIAAEFLDFLILFFLKLAVTFIAVDFFDLIDLDKFDLDLFNKDVKLKYDAVVQMTQDIIVLECVHRVVVCIFETFWLQGGLGGRLGGATPGKSFLGLRVIRCESSQALRPDSEELILVKPGTNLGLSNSFFRALVKNVVIAFFIPASFVLLYFRHNRTGYDMICRTIVVEEPLTIHRANNNNNNTNNNNYHR